MAQYSRSYSLLTVGTSAITSRVLCVQDAASISLSLQTVAASVVSVEGSNFEGFVTAIPENTFSNMTVLTSNGIFNVQAGARWLRVRQALSTSSASVQVSLRVH